MEMWKLKYSDVVILGCDAVWTRVYLTVHGCDAV
jgi:hypothetical protein